MPEELAAAEWRSDFRFEVVASGSLLLETHALISRQSIEYFWPFTADDAPAGVDRDAGTETEETARLTPKLRVARRIVVLDLRVLCFFAASFLSGGPRLDFAQGRGGGRNAQVVIRLEVQPELWGHAEVLSEAQGNVRADGPLLAYDFIDAREMQRLCELVGGEAQRFHELCTQNFAGVSGNSFSSSVEPCCESPQ